MSKQTKTILRRVFAPAAVRVGRVLCKGNSLCAGYGSKFVQLHAGQYDDAAMQSPVFDLSILGFSQFCR